MPSPLLITASAARPRGNAFAIASEYMVNRTMRTSGIISFRTDAATMPLVRGMATSRRTRSGFNSQAFSIASSPFTASPQTSRFRCAERYLVRTPREVSLSSATRMRLDSTIIVIMGAPENPVAHWRVDERGGRLIVADNQLHVRYGLGDGERGLRPTTVGYPTETCGAN